MDSKPPSSSEIINNVVNLAISRRGGVRTRSGRLPPINMRDLTSNKKVVAPNIPQRRKNIKTEPRTSEQIVVKTERQTSFENTRGRGKGKQQRVYLQTGGSFLAEGPAARLKRDRDYNDGVSIPRISRKSGKGGSDKNIDADAVKDLMESYVDGEEYENDYEGKPPFRLPLQKDKVTCKVKLEPDSDPKIKKEIVEDFETGVKKEIKTEIDSDSVLAEDNIKEEIKSEKSTADNFLNIKAEIDSDDFVPAKDNVKEEIKSEKPSADNFLNVKDNGTLILLQLPLLSDSLKREDCEKEKGAKEKDKQPVKETKQAKALKFIDNLEEGFIGKLKIMKSGRIKLTLGSVEFELLDGTPSETYQEAASIQLQDEEGDLTVLGKIENKLIISPVINKLLAENEKLNRFGGE